MAEYTLKAKLTADAKDLIDGIKKAKDEVSSLGNLSKTIGSKFTNLGGSVSKVGNSLTNKITKPAMVAGAAVGGISLAKGFKRLVGIDNARAKLKGLGHDAQSIEEIMKSANESVLGTSYGLDEAATTAASAVAAGIKPGKELTRYLSLTGDTAAIAGAELSEMGSVINKVQTSNKAYNSELQQLSDRGLPIYQWLAEEANTTADAVFDMASQGEISSEMMLNAIENNIGGAAKKMGEESFTAGIANMWAAVGRLGASFLDAGGKGGGFFSQLKPLIADFTNNIDDMGDIAEKAGVKFGEMFMNFIDKVKAAKQWWNGLNPAIQNVIKNIAIFGSVGMIALGPALKIVGFLSTAFGNLLIWLPKIKAGFLVVKAAIAGISTPILITVGVITALIGIFVLLYNKVEIFRESINTAFSAVKDAVMNAVGAVVDFVQEIFGELVDWWQENNELIQSSSERVWGAISTVIESVINVIKPIIIDTWNDIKMVTKIVWEAIKLVIGVAMDLILGIVKVTMQIINGDWEGAWETIKDTASKIWGRIKSAASNIFSAIKENVVGKFNQIKQQVTEKVQSAKENAVNKFNSMKQGIMDKATQIVTSASRKFTEVKNKIISPIEKAKNKISEIVDKIKGFFSGMKLSLPKIKMPKMPKFSLSGKFSLMPPSVPKLNVNWNKDGGIFSRPTIFNTANAGMQGVGEAGREAILPLNSSVLAGIGRGIASASGLNGGKKSDALLQATLQQNKLLADILDKDTNTYIDTEQLEPPITKIQERNKKIRESFA